MRATAQLRAEPLPVVDGVELAAAHLPGREDCCDWYDVIVLRDGSLALAIGDVSGRGDAAYAPALRMRDAVRERALDGDAPGDVVAHVNDLAGDEVATLMYVAFTPATGELRGSNAGHPPALIRRLGGGIERWDAGLAAPIGAAEPGQRYPEERVALARGEALLLYTDGLIERRGAPVDVTLGRLEQAMPVFGSAAGLRTAVLDAMLGDDDHDDDVAVLALAIPHGG